MPENLSEIVGLAMHDDLLMRPRYDARVAEAHRELRRQRRGKVATPYREWLARVLCSIADWLAPRVVSETIAAT
jgi:hypothetical protein